MKKFFLSITTLFVLVMGGNAQNTFPSTGSAGIGTSSPNASSLLEVKSTTKGVLIPRMTSAQRAAIVSPATGLLVYQTDGTTGFYYYNAGWKLLLTSAANTALSNLSSTTAINHTLTPGTTSSFSLGSSSKKWKKGYFSDSLISGSLTAGSTGVPVGVTGTGSSYGVYGNSPYLGVYGSGASYGVYGGSSDGYGAVGVSNTSYGVYGSGVYGLYAVGSSYGVRATTTNGYGLWSSSTNSAAIYSVGGPYGVYSYGTIYGVYGSSSSGNGVYGISTNKQGGWFQSQNSQGLWAKTVSGDYAGVFEGNVYSYGTYSGSDKNLKKNIQDVGDVMSIINKLKPKNYEFRDDGKYAAMNLPKGHHYGLIAQELEEVLPELVANAPHGLGAVTPIPQVGKNPPEIATVAQQNETSGIPDTKAINYTELIPILIKGMQELNAKNTDLQNQVNDLKLLLSKNGNATSLSGYLKQNIPNPSNNNTVISYYVPDNAGYAQIKITDVKGSVIKTFNAAKGGGQVNLKSGELPAGTYNYTLYVNNKPLDTKQMVITK